MNNLVTLFQSLTVTKRGPKQRFAALDTVQLTAALERRFPDWEISHRQVSAFTKKAVEFGGGQRSWIDMRSPELIPGINDKVRGRIMITDQDFAGKALTVSFGLYRLVCSNGLMAWRSVAEPIRIPHTLNKTQILMQLDQLIESSAAVFDKIIAEAVRLQSVSVERPIAVIEQLGLPKTLTDRLTRIVLAYNGSSGNNGLIRAEDNINTVYGLYNFINEVDRRTTRLVRGVPSNAPMQRDTALLDRILQLVA